MRVKYRALTQLSWQCLMPRLHQQTYLASPIIDVALKVELGNTGDYFFSFSSMHNNKEEAPRWIPAWYIFKQSYGNLLRGFLKYVHMHNFIKEYKFNFCHVYSLYIVLFYMRIFSSKYILHIEHIFPIPSSLHLFLISLSPISLFCFSRPFYFLLACHIHVYIHILFIYNILFYVTIWKSKNHK